METITRLFDSHTEALDAVTELEASGVSHDRISIVSNNADNWHAAQGSRREGASGDNNRDGDNEVAEDAGIGAAAGGLLGGGAGLLAGLGMLAIPGLGPVVAAGWLVSTAVGAVAGAFAGSAVGGLVGALKEAGHSDEEAHVYSEGVRRGGTLVSIRVNGADKGRFEAILNEKRGFDAATRGEAYRQSGWTRFDADAAPYTPAQIDEERARNR